MFIPVGGAGDSVSADVKGITLAEEQTAPSGVNVLKVIGTAADASILINPATAPVAGPIGLAADLAVSIAEKSPRALIPTAVGAGVNAGLKASKLVSKPVAERVSAGTELLLDKVME